MRRLLSCLGFDMVSKHVLIVALPRTQSHGRLLVAFVSDKAVVLP